MNSHIGRKFCCLVAVAFVVLGLNVAVRAQKAVLPPPENAGIETLQKWIVEAFPKYTTYKTRTTSIAVSQVRFDGCALKFMRSQKAGTMISVTEGARRSVSTFKNDVTLDLRSIRTDNASLVDHLYPELQTLEIKLPNESITEIVIKRPAAEALRSALIAAGRLCS